MNSPEAGSTRRNFLVGAATMLGAGAMGIFRASAADAPESLREYAAQKGIIFGSAISNLQLHDAPYSSLLARQCAIAVPENALKWAAVRPTPASFDFSASDALYQFAHFNNMLFRGHTLVWEQALPKWFQSTVNSANAKQIMLDHISQVVRHYTGKMHSWDVVNEAYRIEDGRPDGLKVTPWLQFIGPGYIEMAFHAAHEADPEALLVYNENWLEPDDATAEKKRQSVLAMLKDFRKRNVPIHALGTQSHIYAETNTTGPNYKRFLEQVSDLGLAILVTEMDIRDKQSNSDLGARDRLIAKQYYDYLSFMLQFKALTAVLTWGLTDRYTWLAQAGSAATGLPVRPLPYDEDLQPTPSWNAIRRAFEEAPGKSSRAGA
jgi:endo-1,4-beta-xylanase